MSGIFISYRRKDAGGYAGHLRDDLVRRYGRNSVFMDIDSIHGGVDFRERIHAALDSSDVALVLIGDHWTAGGDQNRRIDQEGDLVRREVAAALRHEQVTVVPILVDGAAVPLATELPSELAALPNLQVCHLRNGEWSSDVAKINRAIEAARREPWHKRAAAAGRRIVSSKTGLAAALVAIVVAAAITAMAESGGGGGALDCVNRHIPATTRQALSKAAGSPQPAVRESVFFGSCGAKTWALASFPNHKEDVFALNGVDWVDLGPAVTAKCREVPSEMLDAWGLNDC